LLLSGKSMLFRQLKLCRTLSDNSYPTWRRKMPRTASGSESDRIATYLDVILLIERLHRQFLEVVSLELDSVGIYDINNVQALMLFNIGDSEMKISELNNTSAYLCFYIFFNFT